MATRFSIPVALLAIATSLCLLSLSSCRERATPAPPRAGLRIVALSPAVALIVKELGYQGQIIGRHAWDTTLSPDVTVCGDQAGIDYETLLTVHPTHVLTQWGSRTLPTRLLELAQANGWVIHDSRLLSLDDIIASTEEIDALLGTPTATSTPNIHSTPNTASGTQRGRDLVGRMNRAWSLRGDGFANAGRVLLLASVSPPSALGPGSCHDDILKRIGGTPAITQGSAYIELDHEDIVRLAPDAIILILPRAGAAGTQDPESPLANLARLDTPAARTGRMAIIDSPLSHTPSTPMIEFADDLARTLEQWKGPAAAPGKP